MTTSHHGEFQRAERMLQRAFKAEAEVERLKGLAQRVLDALDAEKTPDYEVGHDRAYEAALSMLGKKPKSIEGQNVPLRQLPPRDDLGHAWEE